MVAVICFQGRTARAHEGSIYWKADIRKICKNTWPGRCRAELEQLEKVRNNHTNHLRKEKIKNNNSNKLDKKFTIVYE